MNWDLEELPWDSAWNNLISNTHMLKVSNKVKPIFYPVGLKALVIVKTASLMWEVWGRRLGWDTKIPYDILRQGNVWKQSTLKLLSLNTLHWITLNLLNETYLRMPIVWLSIQLNKSKECTKIQHHLAIKYQFSYWQI